MITEKSESRVLDQLAEKGIDPSKITHLYSERQLCPVCGPFLDEVAPNAEITWSVPWGDSPVINRASDDLLFGMIRAHGG